MLPFCTEMPGFPALSEFLEAAKSKNLFSPSHQQRRKPWQLTFFNAKSSGADLSHPDKGLNFRFSQRLNGGRSEKSLQPNPILQKSISNAIGEDNLDAMVHDFIENGSAEQDLHCHEPDGEELSSAESNLKALLSQSSEERELFLATASIISTFNVASIGLPGHATGCNGTCIRCLLIKHLKMAGYNAALCKVKWHSIGEVPGGCYEFIDVLLPSDDVNNLQRLIVDIDFRSQFTIARPVSQYEAILRLVPLIFVGSSTKLERILQFMAEAAKNSLKESSLIVPPWRKLEYIRAKWFSAYGRITCSDESSVLAQKDNCEYCRQHLQHLKKLLCTVEDR